MQVEDFNSIDFNIFPFEAPMDTAIPTINNEQDLYNILLDENVPQIPAMDLQEQLNFLTPTGMDGSIIEQPVQSEEENSFSYSSSPSSISSPSFTPSSPSDEELLNQLLNGDPTALARIIGSEEQQGINPFVLIKQEDDVDVAQQIDTNQASTANEKPRKRRKTNNNNGVTNNSGSCSSSPVITGQKRTHDEAFNALLDEPNPEVVVNMTTAELKQLKNHFSPEQVKEIKKQRRMLKNRLSAHESRMRKKNHIDELEAQIAEINKDRDELRQKVDELSTENQQLKKEVDVLRKETADNTVIQSVLNGVSNLTTTVPSEPAVVPIRTDKQRVHTSSRPSSPGGNIKTMGVCLAVVLFSFGMFFNSHPDFANSVGPSFPFENMIMEPSAALKFAVPDNTHKFNSIPAESRQRVGNKVILGQEEIKPVTFMAEAYKVDLSNYGAEGVNKTSLVLVPISNFDQYTNSSIIVGPPSPL